MFWVDNYYFKEFLAERGIYPVKEIDQTAYYHYNKRFKEARESYMIERCFYRSHKFEY